MSDSDSTWPATDDFGSRFLEFDEYSGEPFDGELLCPPKIQSSSGTLFNRQRKRNIRLSSESDAKVRGADAQHLPAYAPLIEDQVALDVDDSSIDLRRGGSLVSKRFRSKKRPRDCSYDDNENDDNVDEIEFPAPKLFTARQMSLHMKRVNGTRLHSIPTASTLLSLECLEKSKPLVTPTPEQIAARQRNIARRRESAIKKAELQKRQTVERLLKVNTNSECFRRRGRGRGARFMHTRLHSSSSTSLLSVTPNNITEVGIARSRTDDLPESIVETSDFIESKPPVCGAIDRKNGSISSLDPPASYIRFISSSRLSPTNRICFSPSSDKMLSMQAVLSAAKPVVPIQQLCSQGCGRPRRYASSITGLPLCSLTCYKASLAEYGSNPCIPTTAVG